MKKISVLLVVAVASLASCKKRYCWECSTSASNSATITKASYCDQTEEEIKSKIGTTSAIDSTGTKPIAVIYTTTCSKKN
ncbi:MAG: hypothetical protein JNL72_11110 [Flavipsychrobacter sp.]|nr:hypothetical protein [Flavipsychrobacter sp.]